LIISIILGVFFVATYFISIIISNIIDIFIIKEILLGIVFLLILSYYSRFLLVFPAISIDKPINLYKALEISKNHKVLVLFTVVLVPLFLSFLLIFVYGLAIEFLAKGISEKLYMLDSLLSTFVIIIVLSFLSTTYEYLISLKSKEEVLREPEIIKKENIYKMIIDDRYDISFDILKETLYAQYETLGFTLVVIDKENSWMIKKTDYKEAYISLAYTNKSYVVETFNVIEEPIIEIKKRL
ncbi:hypothetical protein CRU99_12475, partial [Malaciobacter mytili]|uniref:hypothetical protein n=1 Tax=Malaciobacter mytili TaxID=603050 RepID=UPI0010260E9D